MFGKGQEREFSIAELTATTGSYLMWLLSDSSTLLGPELPQVNLGFVCCLFILPHKPSS